ncbi:TPA: hypothetical protein SK994_000465 [Staphylococcus aureus]|nr:hypothetical protein [Staphylococcus aureus]
MYKVKKSEVQNFKYSNFEVERKQCFIPGLQNGEKRDKYEQLNQEEVKTPSFSVGYKNSAILDRYEELRQEGN